MRDCWCGDDEEQHAPNGHDSRTLHLTTSTAHVCRLSSAHFRRPNCSARGTVVALSYFSQLVPTGPPNNIAHKTARQPP